MRALARMLFWTLGTVGWLGILALQATLMPLVYPLVHVFIDDVGIKIQAGLATARRDLRTLRMPASSKKSRRELPPRR